MGRRRKGPWQRGQDGCYYTTVGRDLVKLGAAEDPWDQIEQVYHLAHAKGEKPSTLMVAWLADQFLEYVQQNRAETTYDWYHRYLQSFVRFTGPKLRVDNLSPALVLRWANRQSVGTRHAAARCAARLCNWAVNEHYLVSSPLRGLVKPPATNREIVITAEQYALCKKHAKQPFLDVVEFLWETGCRPQEVRMIEAAWLDGHRIVFPKAKSKGRKKARIVFLTDTSLEIVCRLFAEFPDGPIFRNKNGKPWHKDAIICAFSRLRQKTKIKGLCAYAFRHTWITNMLKAGVDISTVAALSHNSVRTILLNYEHVARDEKHLTDAVKLGAVKRSGVEMPAATETQQAVRD
jgi:integrase